MNAQPIFVIAFTIREMKNVCLGCMPSFRNNSIFTGISINKVIANIMKKYKIKNGLINCISWEPTHGNQKTPSQPPFRNNDNTNPDIPLTKFEIANRQNNFLNSYSRFRKK